MPNPTLTLSQVLSDQAVFRLPRILAFNRLEPRPRTLDFTRSLRAEVRDPLWMLTRQWQFGEFQGEDAASPVTSRIDYRHESVDRIAFPGGGVGGGAAPGEEFTYDPLAMPLETRVERERIPLTVREMAPAAPGEMERVFSDVLFAVQWGRLFLRLLRAAGLDGHYALYLQAFPIRVLPPNTPGAPLAVLDPDAEAVLITTAGQVADGVAIWRAVQNGTHDPWLDAQPGADPALKPVAASFAAQCTARFQRLFTQPESATDTAWLKNHLEYAFIAAGLPDASGQQTVLEAGQYYQGRLDWYSFDASARQVPEPEPAPPPVLDQVESFLPTGVRFKGQPQPRFWEMEESQTDFGKIDTSTTGLLHLLLAEFGLIYSNDWFMLPHPMAINTICEIRGILVDDTFGRHTFIRPAGRGSETQWQRWAMFHQTEQAAIAGARQPGGSRFYLAPSLGRVLASDPLERVNFLRDEMANMAWAVEDIVPSQTGIGLRAAEAQPPQTAPEPLVSDNEKVKIRYVLGTTVPPNWIPFIPVHAEGSVSEIRLQRARMVGGQPPRGWLLREPGSPYFIEEEEVPRAGAYVERAWQRARWIGGRTFVWVGREKTAGRGEGWSQLVFDQIVDLQVKKAEG